MSKVVAFPGPESAQPLNRKDLEDCFDGFWETLQKHGFPQTPLRMLWQQRLAVLKYASHRQFRAESLAIVPILPPAYADLYHLLDHVILPGGTGSTMLDTLGFIHKPHYPPVRPYFLIDVQYYRAPAGVCWDAEEIQDKAAREHRLLLTEFEVACLAILTEALENRALNALGCRYISDRIPVLTSSNNCPHLILGDGSTTDFVQTPHCAVRFEGK